MKTLRDFHTAAPKTGNISKIIAVVAQHPVRIACVQFRDLVAIPKLLVTDGEVLDVR